MCPQEVITLAVKVGIRRLRDGLSAYLRRVREGESILVVDRGEPVARIVPMVVGSDGLVKLAARGVVRWSGGKPRVRRNPPKVREGRVSHLVVEDRR
jgi:prevent-host-death family protein